MSEPTLPHNLEAERSILGAILIHAEAFDAAAQLVTPEDFYRDAHGRIFAQMIALQARNQPIEFVTLKDALTRAGELEEVGGPAYVSSLADGMPRATNIEYYARIVKERSTLRKLIVAAKKVISSAYDASEDASDVLTEAEQVFLGIGQETALSDLISAAQLLPDTIALLERIAETGRPVTGLETGIPRLDDYTRGLHPGNLIVLGGRPAEGKSALALQMALHAGLTAPVAFFSMEMNRDEIMTRALAQLARIDHHQMMQGRLGDGDKSRLGRAINRLEQVGIYFDDVSGITPMQIRSKARKLQSRIGLGLVVVDYLQLLQRPRTAHSREEAVAENTWALKMLAGELKVPVLALSQLNRSSQAREDKRPSLSDLRESGAVEQHANVVLLIYRPPEQHNGAVVTVPPVELLIAKQRNGPQHVKVDLVFQGPSMRFEEVTPWRGAA